MQDELLDAFGRADADDEVRAVVVTGAGRGFCAGADLSAGAATFDYKSRPGSIDEHRDGGGKLTLRIFESKKPVIAAVNWPRSASDDDATGRASHPARALRIAFARAEACCRKPARAGSCRASSGSAVPPSGSTPAGCSTRTRRWRADGFARGVARRLLPAAYAPAREIAENIRISVTLAPGLWRMLGADHPMESAPRSIRRHLLDGPSPTPPRNRVVWEKRKRRFAMRASSACRRTTRGGASDRSSKRRAVTCGSGRRRRRRCVCLVPASGEQCASAQSPARGRSQLRERRPDLGEPRRAVGESGCDCEDSEVDGARGWAASIPAARRPPAVALGIALPGRMPAGAESFQRNAASAARPLQPRDAARAARNHGHRIRPPRARHPPLHQPGGARSQPRREIMRGFGSDQQSRRRTSASRSNLRLRIRRPLAGGSYSASDETGDAYKLPRRSRAVLRPGRQFDTGATIQRIVAEGDQVTEIEIAGRGAVRADAYVLSLGSYSPMLARPLGISLAIYPAKGYSITMPVKDPSAAWTVSLSDEAHKLVLSRLGERLRIAGTAELAGHDTSINEKLPRDSRSYARAFSRRRRVSAVLGRPAPCDAGQHPVHRPHALPQPVPQYRPRHAGLDASMRLGASACGYHRRTQARSGLQFHVSET